MSNRVVLVTGSSRGIGRAIAQMFAKNGDIVIVNYQGNEQAAKETLEDVQKTSPDSMMIKANISNTQDVDQMFETIKKTYGRIDVLVNNSGINRDGLLLRMSESDFDDVINVNLKGTYLCSKAASRMMLRQKKGSIINMSSVVGVYGNAGQANYAASKAGIIGFTKSLAKELGSRNIRVNAIAPGFIQTAMTENLDGSLGDHIALKRLGQPEDIANVAFFLASQQSSYITGQVIQVDGGMSL